MDEQAEREVAARLTDRITPELLADRRTNGKLNYWMTPTEAELFRDYLPSMFHKVKDEVGLKEDGDEAERLSKLAFQLQSEIVNKSSTIDAGIVHGKRDEGSVASKIYNLGRHYRMLSMLGMRWFTQGPMPDGHAPVSPADLDRTLVALKESYADILYWLPAWAPEVETETRRAQLTPEDRRRFAYVDGLLSRCGEDGISAIVAYGSASREADENEIHDYDNFLVVDSEHMPSLRARLYKRLVGSKPVNPHDGKPVGVNVIDRKDFAKFLRLNHDPKEHRVRSKVLYGKADFPVVLDEEINERGTSYGMIRLKAVKSACIWVGEDPGVLSDKPELFDYFQKSLLFITQSALNATEGIRYRPKEELRQRMAEVGAEVYPFKPDPAYIRDTTYRAGASATRLVEKHFGGRRLDTSVIEFPECHF